MVTTATQYTDSRYQATLGQGYDGVVRITANGYYGTGALLYPGNVILTAAHLVSGSSPAGISVQFETSGGVQAFTAKQTLISPLYDSGSVFGDIALVWLDTTAPAAADRYDIYRGTDELGQVLTLVGYGLRGTGTTGAIQDGAAATRLKATNLAEADASTLKVALGSSMSWTPVAGTTLVADFDNGQTSKDALGLLLGIHNLGQGSDEGMIAPGDSGGPAFINGGIAGVASYTASLQTRNVAPDADGKTDSTFGELAFCQRVSYYQQWIDQSIRAAYKNAPSKPADVTRYIAEGDQGSTTTYFLVQFTGQRKTPDEKLSVTYATRDGSAKAGEDYIATKGTLVLYPGETQAVIPVQVLGDRTPEQDEVFYLDISNPVGGTFGPGLTTLTAARTILNDDWA